MKTHLEHKFISVQRYTALFIWPEVMLYYACAKPVWGKMSTDGKSARCRTIIFYYSVTKRYRKEVLANYNKTRINIGHQNDCCVELKEALIVQVMLKCKHQNHCACSLEIGKCVIYDAVIQAAAHKSNENTRFWWNRTKRRSIFMFWRYILTFVQRKKKLKKLSKELPKSRTLYLWTSHFNSENHSINQLMYDMVRSQNWEKLFFTSLYCVVWFSIKALCCTSFTSSWWGQCC